MGVVGGAFTKNLANWFTFIEELINIMPNISEIIIIRESTIIFNCMIRNNDKFSQSFQTNAQAEKRLQIELRKLS